MATARDIAVWQRMVGTSWDDLPAGAAEGLLRLTFSDRDMRRMSESTDRPLTASEHPNCRTTPP